MASGICEGAHGLKPVARACRSARLRALGVVETAHGQVWWADAPGNTVLTAKATGLPRDSVANGSLITLLDRECFTERVGKLTPQQLTQILNGIDVILGR